VPLALTLLYESRSPVADQSILKVQDVNSTCVKRGHASLHVRIEEVSRNHRQQGFQVLVGPNVKEWPLDQDVGPALSPRVAVYSKHTKRSKPGGAGDDAGAAWPASGIEDRHIKKFSLGGPPKELSESPVVGKEIARGTPKRFDAKPTGAAASRNRFTSTPH
jgi:hypothetical protein